MNMQQLEKYASSVQRKAPASYAVKKTKLKPKLKKIKGIKAALVDIYGTFFISSRDGLAGGNEENAFRKTVKEFKLAVDWKTLRELYHEEIKKEHKRKRDMGIQHPEILIENRWANILRKIKARKVNKFKIAYFFDLAKGRDKTYSGAFVALKKLREKGIALGIVSNSQFYTTINLNLLLRGLSNGRIKKWQDFFNPRICTFSFKEGFSKPNIKSFERQKKKFRAKEMVFVGNDMLNDIWTAKRAGLHAVLFAGDAKSIKLRKENKKIRGTKPDAVITNWKQLLKVVG